jgi:hypothetical protein
MTDTKPEYLVGVEAEISLAREAASQLHARLQAQQAVLQMLLEHLGIDIGKVERWVSAMADNDLPAMAEQSRVICQAIRGLPAR